MVISNRERKQVPVQGMLNDNYLKVETLYRNNHELSIVPHKHDHYELICIYSGEGTHYINFKPYPVSSGRIYFIQTGQVHIIPEFEREGLIFIISEELIHQFLGLYPSENGKGIFDPFTSKPYIDSDTETLDFLKAIYTSLSIELSVPQPDKRILFSQISSLLLKVNNQHAFSDGNKLLSKDYSLMKRLRELITIHYREEHGVEFYREKLALPAKSLNRICVETTGRTVHGLLEDKLITEACSMLLTGNRSIKEIAFSLGFQDPAYFGRVFKKVVKVSPESYRFNEEKKYQT